MKIKEINNNSIIFDNGKMMYSVHNQDCCEFNYADFGQVDDLARNYEFDEFLMFEKVDGCGFKFGDCKRMFFVPCYSDQSGFYSDEVDIYYNGVKVLVTSGVIR